MLLTDVFPHTILPKNCLPAVACSVFCIYTIYKLCSGEERCHSGVGREKGKMRWALRIHPSVRGDDRNCCEVVIISLRKQSWIRNATNFFFMNKFSFSSDHRKKKEESKNFPINLMFSRLCLFIFSSHFFVFPMIDLPWFPLILHLRTLWVYEIFFFLLLCVLIFLFLQFIISNLLVCSIYWCCICIPIHLTSLALMHTFWILRNCYLWPIPLADVSNIAYFQGFSLNFVSVLSLVPQN